MDQGKPKSASLTLWTVAGAAAPVLYNALQNAVPSLPKLDESTTSGLVVDVYQLAMLGMAFYGRLRAVHILN